MWLCLLQVVSLSADKMAVDGNCDHILKWKDRAKQKQQEYYNSPHIVNWRECKLSDISNLKEIIEFASCGISEEEPVENFTDKQLKQIYNISGKSKKSKKKVKDENIRVSVLFVLAKLGGGYLQLPVIKLLKHDTNIQQDNIIFIDFCGRVYKNWEDFLKNNTLHNVIICYPKNGVYSAVNGVVEVEYGISPDRKRGRKFLRDLHMGYTVLGVAAALIGIAALCFPVALPVVAG